MADESRNESQEQPQAQEAEQAAAKEQQPAPAPESRAEAPSQPSAQTEQSQGGKRGCSLFAWIVILAIILAVAAYLVHKAQVEEQKRKAEELAKRRAVRQSQLAAIGNDIAKALEVAQEGDIAKTLMILEAQENLLATIAREASASGDNEDAQEIVAYKAAVSQVADAIRQKEEELKTFAIQQISSLGSKFPQVKEVLTELKAPAAAEEQKSGEAAQEAAPEQAGGGQQQPQAESGEEQQQAGGTQPQEVGP